MIKRNIARGRRASNKLTRMGGIRPAPKSVQDQALERMEQDLENFHPTMEVDAASASAHASAKGSSSAALPAWKRSLESLRSRVASRSSMQSATSTALVISSRHRLWQRYGPDGVFLIERALGELFEAMGRRGISGALAYTDDSPLLGQFGVLPARPGDARDIARVVRELGQRIQFLDQDLRYVLILGDDGIVPFDRPTNPSPDDEDELFSDHLYASGIDEKLCPVRAVGRIPDRGLALMVDSIRSAADSHRRLARAERPLTSDAGFGYSASIWKRPARGVYSLLGDPKQLRLSPPLTRAEMPSAGPSGPRYRYFNLHGMVDSAAWYGQRDPAFAADYDRLPVALRPEDLTEAPGSAVFSAACYGAHLKGRAVHDSMALSSIEKGAQSFVGATGVAYGGLEGGLVAADLMAFRYWEALRSGAPAGQALAHAKWSLISETLARQGYVDAEDEKAVLNFVLYGDPSLVFHVSSEWAEDAPVAARVAKTVEAAGPAHWVGTPSVRPQSIHQFDAVSSASGRRQVVRQVQKTVSRFVPEFAGRDVGVATAPAPRRVHAKSGLLADDPNSGPMVVTLRRNGRTSEGANCPEVMRVTVDRSGTIRKLTVSR